MELLEAFMNVSPFLSIHRPCDEVLRWAKKRLSHAGLRVMQTFDLHTVRAEQHSCTCPNHGTEECDCQIVVLLVYGKTEGPVTLFLHGNDGRTWLSIADETHLSTDSKLLAGIKQALSVPVSIPQKI